MHTIQLRALCALLLFSSLLAAFAACKSRPFPSAEVAYVSVANQGDLLKMTAVGYGTNEREVIADAARRAFETLLFKGLSGSPVQYPMVTDPNARQTQKAYFKQLLDEKGYRNHLAGASSEKLAYDKRSRRRTASVTLDINLFTLRRELEQNNITRTFGL